MILAQEDNIRRENNRRRYMRKVCVVFNIDTYDAGKQRRLQSPIKVNHRVNKKSKYHLKR